MSASYVIISPNGDVTSGFDDPMQAALLLFPSGMEVVSLRSPLTEGVPGLLVGYVGSMSRSQPLNTKAWALYGRSPICGDMVATMDSHEDGSRETIPDEWVAMLAGDCVPEEIKPMMRDVAFAEGCVVTYPI